MRIIGKDRDYYDTIASYGVDDNVLFVREANDMHIDYPIRRTKNSRLKPTDSKIRSLIDERLSRYAKVYRKQRDLNNIRSPSPYTSRWNRDAIFRPFVVVFCGKIYPGIKVNYEECWSGKNYNTIKQYDAESYCYDIETLKKYAVDNDLKRIATNESLKALEFWFEPIQSLTVDDYLVEVNRPYVVHSHLDIRSGYMYDGDYDTHSVVFFNPILERFQFVRAVDPWSAYQEIEMYLGNVLCVNNEDIPQIDDKHMALQKGFDKWSFKKMPTKKR